VLVLGGYGLTALAFLYRFHHQLKRIPAFHLFLIIGVVWGALSLTMDAQKESLAILYVEEGAKVLANASFLMSCLSAGVHNYKSVMAAMERSLLESRNSREESAA
jgi:hypothetical protein